MPETLAGLWAQRLRWAMGGLQVIYKYRFIFRTWKLRRMWPVYLEYVTSVAWAGAMALVVLLWLANRCIPTGPEWQVTLLPGWNGVVIGVTCLLQILLAMLLDRRYDERLFRHYFWMVWYPLVYWMLNMTTTLWALPKLFLRRRGQRATWVSPDRGVRASAVDIGTITPAPITIHHSQQELP
jgi:biofilm PGA synthesis N-glycosyltransferase PgaC